MTTWPLALHLRSAVPLGTETAATIPVFDIWTLWWAGGRLWHGYADFWNAPIFHPTPGAFAFSEPMVLPGLVGAPLFALGGPPALVHNVVLLAILVANGVFGARLARALGVARLPALFAGVLVLTMPLFAKLQGELPILAVAGTLAALDGVVRFGQGARAIHAFEAAAGLVAQALSCEQLTLYALPFVGAAALLALHERRFSRSAIRRLGAAMGAAAVVVYGLARTPLGVHGQLGFQRSAELFQSLSATPLDFLTRPLHALIPFPAREDATTFTGGLFPGVAVLVLAAVGARVVPLRREPDVRARWRWYALGASLVAWSCCARRPRRRGYRFGRSPYRHRAATTSTRPRWRRRWGGLATRGSRRSRSATSSWRTSAATARIAFAAQACSRSSPSGGRRPTRSLSGWSMPGSAPG